MISGPALLFLLLSVLPLLMIVAALADVATLTIPNSLNILIAFAFLAIAPAIQLPLEQFGWHVLASLAVLAIFFGLFALNLIGGGDAKMAAAVALWLGPSLMLDWLLWTTIFGGVLAIIVLIFRAMYFLDGRLPSWLARLHDRTNGLPYGVAIGGAAILVYPSSSIFDAIMKIAA